MDGLIVLIVIVWAIASSVKKKGKAKQAHKAGPAQTVQPIQPAKPAQAKAAADGKETPARQKPAAAVKGNAAQPVRQELAPRVQTTVHVTEHDHTGMFDGSMGDASLEGEDPFHDHGQRPVRVPSQYSDRIINADIRAQDAPQETASGLDLGWDDRDSLVRAFVMQEVLTRPCDRKR